MLETALYIVGFLVILLVGYLLRNRSTLFFILQLILLVISGWSISVYLSNKDKREETLQRKIELLEYKQRAISKDDGGNISVTEKIEIRDGVEKREITTIKNGVKTINKTEKKISVFGD
jgi:hypothetical protein